MVSTAANDFSHPHSIWQSDPSIQRPTPPFTQSQKATPRRSSEAGYCHLQTLPTSHQGLELKLRAAPVNCVILFFLASCCKTVSHVLLFCTLMAQNLCKQRDDPEAYPSLEVLPAPACPPPAPVAAHPVTRLQIRSSGTLPLMVSASHSPLCCRALPHAQ